jgi:hypothetical protein
VVLAEATIMRKIMTILAGVVAAVVVQLPLTSTAGPTWAVEHKRMPSANCSSCHPDGGGTVPPGLRAFFNPSGGR